MLLILGVAIILFVYIRYVRDDYEPIKLISQIDEPVPTNSQKTTLIYFLVAMVLFLLQASLGSLTAHFTVEGTYFFGIPIGKIFPYAATRTWHLQLAVFWIAKSFLATGLFIGPFIGHEPKGQSVLVKILFVAVVIVVLGALSGTWLSTTGFSKSNAFIFGHQGYEYIELGRLWQILLIIGMIGWLILVYRALKPALSLEEDKWGLVHLLLYSSISIPLFYMAGLMYGNTTHISVAEYWRWWVVHLWVEGFFEVFATVVLAFVLTRIGAISQKIALTNTYMSIFLYLGSGVIGTFHHLYWTGSPTPIRCSIFSS